MREPVGIPTSTARHPPVTQLHSPTSAEGVSGGDELIELFVYRYTRVAQRLGVGAFSIRRARRHATWSRSAATTSGPSGASQTSRACPPVLPHPALTPPILRHFFVPGGCLPFLLTFRVFGPTRFLSWLLSSTLGTITLTHVLAASGGRASLAANTFPTPPYRIRWRPLWPQLVRFSSSLILVLSQKIVPPPITRHAPDLFKRSPPV